MTKPLVSVIIPAYNTEAYIERCLDSIKGQTYEELEVIVINDGSVDHTGEIIDHYSSLDRRIRAVHTKNAGSGHARNVGLDLAKGKWVSFVDSDDYILDTTIETMVREAVRYRCDMVICGMMQEWPDGETRPVPVTKWPEMIEAKKAGRKYNEDAFSFTVCNKLFARALIADCRFPDFTHCQDVLFNRVIFPKTGKIRILPDLFYINVQREGSATRGKAMNKKMIDLHFAVIREMKKVPFSKGSARTVACWNMAPGRLLFEMTVALLLKGEKQKVAYVTRQKEYFRELKRLHFASGSAEFKKVILYILLRLHQYSAAVWISDVHSRKKR